MRFRIKHVTVYRYSNPVSLGTQILRMHPRHDPWTSLDSFALAIHPRPTGLSPAMDLEGNLTHTAWFEGKWPELRISVQSSGCILPHNPYDFLLDPPASGLPVHYGAERPGLDAYLRPYVSDGKLPAFAAEIAASAGGDVLEFLARLNSRMHEGFANIPRAMGVPMDPDATLHAASGSCRDLAVLFIACCRDRGIAARFVSGYVKAPPGEPQNMHAWPEVYLPSAGWRAYDPTQGLAVSENHIAVAAAAEPWGASPVSGIFTGGGARTEMSVELSVETEAL